MADDDDVVPLDLNRLWKGTYLVGIGAGYLFLIAWLLIVHGWKASLLAAFLIGLSQFLRYIANDVDRIGWRLGEESRRDTARRAQSRLLWVLATVVVAIDVAIVAVVYVVSVGVVSVVVAVGLGLIVAAYSRVRRINRKIAYARANFGFSDNPRARESEEIERRLAVLADLARDGKISERALEEARDRYRVRGVMRDFWEPRR